MAIVPFNAVDSLQSGGRAVQMCGPLTGGDTSAVLFANDGAGIAGSIQILGTVAGAVTLKQSNDGAVWYPVKDTAAAAISHTAVGFSEFFAHGKYLRVEVAAGVAAVTALIHLVG